MQCTDHVSYKCTVETYIIELTNVTPINLIKKKRKEKIMTEVFPNLMKKIHIQVQEVPESQTK